MPNKNIGFDMDGTLIDSSRNLRRVCFSCKHVGLQAPPLDIFRGHIGPPIQQIAKQLFPDADSKTLLELKNIFRDSYDNSLYIEYRLYDKVLECINELSKEPDFNLFIVTNKPTVPARNIVSKESLPFCESSIIGIDYKLLLGAGSRFKNKAEALQFYLNLHSLDPAHSVYIGDTVSDKIAAERCSVMFLASDYGFYSWGKCKVNGNLPASNFSILYNQLRAVLDAM